MKFFKIVFATLVGQVLFFIVVVLFLTFLGVALSPSKEKVVLNTPTVLKISLSDQINERAEEDPFEEFGLEGIPGYQKKLGLLEILAALKQATEDKNIAGIFIDAGSVSESLTVVDEVRSAIGEFKKTGKFVLAYGQIVGEGGYYLASQADKFFLNPSGMVEFNGLSAQVVFLKKSLEKLGVKPIVFRVGTFKSAVEPFLREDMSAENDKQYRDFLNSMYGFMLEKISTSRNIPVGELRKIAAQTIIGTSEKMVEQGLVDSLVYFGGFLEILKENTGANSIKDLKVISLNKYISSINLNSKFEKDKIGVVVCEGEIVDFGDEGIVGERTARQIRNLRLDEKVKAVVLRVNSPGGSVMASDAIWQEVVETQKVKPIVASMSSLAASGGYYISMACDKIVSHPLTLTGSIGIFGIWFDPSELLNNKLGITFDTVNTSPYADFGSISRPMKPLEREFMQKWIESGYASFLTKAAQGRKTDTTSIGRYAQGRVWSGLQAFELGLVDTLGNLEDAISIAASMAGVKSYQVTYHPKPKSVIDNFLGRDKDEKIRTAMLKKELGEFYQFYESYHKATQKRGILARLPFDINIK